MVERFEERPSSVASRHRLPRAGEGETLDVIAIGRSSVDLYGAQVGGRLEDMASFSKAVGGCPTNIAIGTARLGLKSGLITRVGDEHMGRFIREQCAREGVDVAGVHTDPSRLTSLVVLGIRDDKTFPLIFYRDNCADSALDESDIDEAFVAQRQGDRRHRNAFRAPRQRRGAETRHRLCEEARPQGRFRHRLSPQSLGPGRPRRGRGALHQIGPGVLAFAARSCPPAISSSARKRRS